MTTHQAITISALDFITHALGVPNAVSPTNRELLARTKLRDRARPEDPRSAAGSVEAVIIDRAAKSLARGSLDHLLAAADTAAEREAAAQELADWSTGPEVNTAVSLLQALTEFAIDHPFIEIERT